MTLKEVLRKNMEEREKQRIPVVLVETKVIYPFIRNSLLTNKEYAVALLTPEAQKLIEKANNPEVQRIMQEITKKRMHAEKLRTEETHRQNNANMQKNQSPIYRLTQAIHYHRANMTFMEEFDENFTETEKREAYRQFLNAVPSQAFNPPLKRSEISFGILFCQQKLSKPQEDCKTLRSKIVHSFSRH